MEYECHMYNYFNIKTFLSYDLLNQKKLFSLPMSYRLLSYNHKMEICFR